MSKAAMIEAWESRKDAYANHWKTGLCTAPCEDCPCCCLVMFCPYCASYSLRKRALYNDMTRYQCCGGFLPCSGRCSERHCPELCLCLESCLCFGMSVAGTRWILQDELRIQNGQCDNCLLTTMIVLQQLACICRITAMITGSSEIDNLADLLSFAAEVLWWTVCACIQTQHKIQMDERDKVGGAAAAGYGATQQTPYAQPAAPYGTYSPGGYPSQMQQGPPGYPPAGYPQVGGYPQSGGYPYPQQPPTGYPTSQPPGYNPQMYR